MPSRSSQSSILRTPTSPSILPSSFPRPRANEPRVRHKMGRSATTGSVVKTSTNLRRVLHDDNRFRHKETSTSTSTVNTLRRNPVPHIIAPDKRLNYKRLARHPSSSGAKAPEITHLEVRANTFFEALIRDSATTAAVGDATSKIVASKDFRAAWKAYSKACKRYFKDEGSDKHFELSQLFVNLANAIIESSPSSLISSRALSLVFRMLGGGEDDSEASSISSTSDFKCAAVLKETTDDECSEWGNILALMHVGFPPPPSEGALVLSSDTSFEATNPAKRRRITVTCPVSPEPHVQESTDEDPLSNDMLEVMSALGNRRHVFGIQVEGLALRFTYYDRAGSVRSNKLDMVTDIEHIIQIFIGLSLCDASQLGMEPLFQKEPPAFGSVIDAAITVGSNQFRIEKVQHLVEQLYGRGTAVYAARALRHSEDGRVREEESNAIPDVVIVKLSWQPASQEPEDEMYKIAARAGVEGITTLYASSAPARLSEGIRGVLSHPSEYCDRELRVQVMGPLCIPLYKVTNEEDFKNTFKSLVKAHRDLYEKAGILHRDISINNLMADPSRPGVGVLIDLDLAIRASDLSTSSTANRTIAGTLPFVSLDLLKDPALPHYYRHDLESFLYVLTWILFHYKDGKYIPSDELRYWYEGSWKWIATSKLGFLASPRQLWMDAPSPPPDLVQSWVVPLGGVFIRGYHSRRETIRSDISLEDKMTLNGEVTFAKFMAVLESQ